MPILSWKQLGVNEMDKRNEECAFEIYKMFVATTQHISECRQQSNNFYILLNSGIVAYNSHFHSFFIIILGILINIVWILKISAYKNLNQAKFQVIEKLEKRLPVQVFHDEYQILKEKNHKNLSYYEKYIPWVFIIVFSAILLHTYTNLIVNMFHCIFIGMR